jgi:phosphoribosylformylglycinamidine synthase
MKRPPIAILHAPGTNRDRDALLALEMAGGAPEILFTDQLLHGQRRLRDYAMLVLPGGFSYGDDLGAGRLWAARLRFELGQRLLAFAQSGKPILGICNGFQVLVKTGLLPGPLEAIPSRDTMPEQTVTLTDNASARFECRWVHIQPHPRNSSPWLEGLERIFCPVAHGEGNFQTGDPQTLDAIQRHGLVAFTYVDAQGRPGPYPINPNGSVADIAGITNRAGNILGLMPHPENHILPHQHPGYPRGQTGGRGLALFQRGVAFARQV